ncbi:MAG: hypothetical protein WBG41_11480 [Acidimicrobiales bacterium]
MTGGEDQSQDVIVDVIGINRIRWKHVCNGSPDFGQLASVGLLPAHEIDGPVLGRRHEPGTWIVRDARLRPDLKRSDQTILRQFLGDSDITNDVSHASDDPGVLNPEDRLN